MNTPSLGFIPETIRVSLGSILPIRQIKDPEKNIRRYRSIFCSIKEVGLIEPLVVYPKKSDSSTYLLLDGHLRHLALKEIGKTEADCIVSTDDESFTYNARIAKLAPIQEHQMMNKAIKNGVPAERIAAALGLDLKSVRSSINLLKGIDDEAVALLRDKDISKGAIAVFKRVTGQRQIEMAELMVSAHDFSKGYAEALLIGTHKSQLRESKKPKIKTSLSTDQMLRMENEMQILERDFKAVEETYGENMLNLTLARGFIKKLLENVKVVRYLNTNHSELFAELEATAVAEIF